MGCTICQKLLGETKGCLNLLTLMEQNCSCSSDCATDQEKAECCVAQKMPGATKTIYVAYDSEDEGHRFTFGKAQGSLQKIVQMVMEYIQEKKYDGNGKSVAALTESQIGNLGAPDCHGQLVLVFPHFDEDWNKIDKENAAAYDWIFVYRLTSE
jgi:hypothetical protein